MKQYKLTVTEEQLVVLFMSLEWFFRMQMGQYLDFANELAKNGYEYDPENPDNERLFREYIYRRDECKEHMEIAYRIAQPRVCNCTEDMNVAIDMWQVIRYFRWKERPEPKLYDTVDSRPPLHRSTEPPMQIERVDHDTE